MANVQVSRIGTKRVRMGWGIIRSSSETRPRNTGEMPLWAGEARPV